MDSLIQDVRHAARRLVQAPGFTAVALIIVGLGVGANAAIFSVVDSFLFRPPPFERPDELVHVYQDSDDGEPSSTSYPAYVDMTQQNEVFSGVTAIMTGFSATWAQDSGDARPIAVAWVTSSYFPTLGIRTHLGRAFDPAHDQTGSEPVAVVSYRTWQREFGADPSVLGRVLRVNGSPVTVVGVGPPGYGGIVSGHNVDIWLSISSLGSTLGPFAEATLGARSDHWFDVIARMEPEVTPQRAQAAMDLLAERLAQEFPEFNEGRDITVFPVADVRIHPDMDSNLYPAGAVLMGVVGLVLLVACGNLANLLLARASTRGREVAIRLAVGASRARLVRHLLTESMLLAIGGGLVGVLVAAWLTRTLTVYQPPLPLPISLALGVDGRVFLFVLSLSVFTGLLFGLVPALAATRYDLVSSLKEAEEAGGSRRSGFKRLNFRSALVVVQVAGSLVLLVGAGLLLRSLRAAQAVDLGFPSADIAIVQLDTRQAGYDPTSADPLFVELAQRAQAVPGVESFAYTTRVPVSRAGSSTMVVEEYTARTGTSAVEIERAVVTPGYFETLRIPLVHGRVFTAADRDGTNRISVVSEAMAHRYWGESDVVGRRFRSQGAADAWIEIVGVVGDVKVETIDESPTPIFYLPLRPGQATGLYAVARASGNPAEVVGTIRSELRAIDPDVPVLEAGTMEDHVAQSLALSRAAAGTLGVLGMVALLLAGIGLYGIVAFAVSQRTAEVGIRMALGARSEQMVGMLVKEVMSLVAVGVVLGLGLAILAAPVLGSMLYGVPPSDPLTLASVAALLTAVALLASWLPARRAARTDPMIALRYE